MLTDLAERWRADLASWAIPQEILDQAEVPPWLHPVASFTVVGEIADSVSHQIARSALGGGGTVVDIGCGGGRASLAIAPPATELIGVDEQQGMLDAYAAEADARGIANREVLGQWPQAAPETPVGDVVVCHHVAFNVPDIVPFLQALHDHARRRVVVELPMHHPMSNLNALWLRFWGLTRPERPTANDLADIAAAMGFEVQMSTWVDPDFGMRGTVDSDEYVASVRRRLCLPADRQADVARALTELGEQPPRELATLWWDRSS